MFLLFKSTYCYRQSAAIREDFRLTISKIIISTSVLKVYKMPVFANWLLYLCYLKGFEILWFKNNTVLDLVDFHLQYIEK